MEWDPRTTASATDSGHGAIREPGAAALHVVPVRARARSASSWPRRRFVGLALAVLAYQTLAAMAFVGATRYRVSTDFLLALLAASAIDWALRRRRRVQ